MTGFLGIAALGILLGIRHAADPDHVVAVTTMVTGERGPRQAALIGLAWGAGHTLTILAVGGAIILLGLTIPARISLSLELLVCAMLVGLGVVNLAQWQGTHGRTEGRTAGAERATSLKRPALVGLVHGMAGSAAVAFLVLATIQDPVGSVFYLLIYGAGTILGMLLVTVAIAVPLHYAGGRVRGLSRTLHLGAGLLSIIAGVVFGYGLFRSPLW
jgi:high-affinity nickel-transport protein